MKTLLQSALLVALISSSLKAQDSETLFGDISWDQIGFMVEPSAAYSPIDGATAILGGARAGVVLADKFTIGGYYSFNLNNIEGNSIPVTGEYLDFQAGGGFLEYTLHADRLFHLSFPLYVGVGEVQWDSEDFDLDWEDEDMFFMVEPAVLCELNLWKYIRLNGGVGYRVVTGVDYGQLDNAALSGITARIGLRMGLFP
jgi:hypothetical protein